MKKKTAAVAVLASCIALTAAFSGCSLVSTNNKADMEQVIARVDITKSDKFGETELSAYSGAIGSTEILKRDLIAYFINVGYSYVQNGSTYADTFNMLVDALVDNAVLTQYSVLALLKDKATNTESAIGYDASALTTYNSFTGDVAKYEYLLGGEDSDDVLLAKYSLYSSINSALDSYETTIISEESSYAGTDTRTTPVNLGTEQDDYYPKAEDGSLDYNVYTGYEGYLLADSGIYKDDALEGTTKATRVKAYSSFINNLRQNYLIDTDTEAENLTDVLALEYIQTEYVAQLESRIVNRYYDIYEAEQEEKLKAGDYSYIGNVYEELLQSQKESYQSTSAFESALSDMSSTSFVLYSPETDDSDKFDGENYGTYGFIYNILLPYSSLQNTTLESLQSIYSANEDDNAYYSARNRLLKQITTEDQRAAWFNGATDYSFKASESGITDYFGATDGRGYLFFEDNLTDSGEGGRYKKLSAYDGRYSYNGSVYETEEGSYILIGNKLDIDGMLEEFSAYINYVLGGENTAYEVNGSYYETADFYKDGSDDEIDYSKFVYATGKVDFGEFNRADLFNATTAQYKAMSAVNELQYAYTTDTSVLSQYIGYSVSAYDTSYIKEFEYAAKLAISKGAGAFTVCAGDYGWHIIYVTYTFEAGETYEPDWTRISTEGTFENLFFEWMKTNDLSDVSTTRRTKIISDFNTDSTVTKYVKTYKDLLGLDS